MGGPSARARLRRVLVAAATLAGVLLVAPAAGAASNSEPFAGSQWGLRQIGAERAWDLSRGRGARVGIIDTGVDLAHAELAGRIAGSTRCIGTGGVAARCTGSAQDDGGHGTHVAGIVAAPLDRAGVAGVAPEASLLVVKALDAGGSGEASDVAAGIDWLLSQGAHVVNLSLAETSSLRRAGGASLEAAIKRAAAAGVVVVMAAGNHAETTQANAAYDLPAIVVAASDRDGRLAPYSQPLDARVRWGLVAPGGSGSGAAERDVISTYWFPGRRSSYAWSAGTSMATPHVAGTAALLAARGVRGQAAVDQLLGTAAAASCGAGCRGRLDAAKALAGPAATPLPATRPAAPPEPARAATAAPAALPAARPAEVPVTEAPKPTVVGPGDWADPGPTRVAIGPVAEPPPPLPAEGRGHLLAWSAIAAGAGLLTVTAATGLLGWRRLRGGAGW